MYRHSFAGPVAHRVALDQYYGNSTSVKTNYINPNTMYYFVHIASEFLGRSKDASRSLEYIKQVFASLCSQRQC